MDTAQLVRQCQSGNKEAFGLLYNHYAPSMIMGIEAYIHNHDVAQDILHDGFIIAFSALADLKSPAKFESWLTTIMKNLSLQYLREAANHKTLPLADMPDEALIEDDIVDSGLSWDELNGIINKLPDGYNKVFRLAVLDRLSHKEIGEMLGIAPHSSSSQLSHAKAMLRRLISEYRIRAICIFTIIFSIVTIWLGINRRFEKDNRNVMAHESDNRKHHGKSQAPIEQSQIAGNTATPPVKIRLNRETVAKENLSKVKQPEDTALVVQENQETGDTISNIPTIPVIVDKELLAENNAPIINKTDNQNSWSLALTYNGNTGQNIDKHYRIPIGLGPDLPSGKPEGIDVTEKSRHYMPLTIGISLNHRLSSRWSVESGIRYTFLRSDFMRESEIEKTETNQQIHYIGVPLKFNYRILDNTRYLFYGQGGMVLDIPIDGTQSIMKWEKDWNKPLFNNLNISAPLQWAVEGGLGFQYQITQSFGVYAELSLRYNFNPGTDIKTIRQVKPFEFNIPIGIRFNW